VIPLLQASGRRDPRPPFTTVTHHAAPRQGRWAQESLGWATAFSASPLVVHIFCMGHLVSWRAPVAATDSRVAERALTPAPGLCGVAWFVVLSPDAY
jgi:hypothetical protein